MAQHRYGRSKGTTQLANQAHERSGISKKLISAVFRQLGSHGEELEQTLKDVGRGGADAGWSGFSYYSDTVAFFKKNRKEILELAKNQADDFGMSVVEMVKGFRCMKDIDATEHEISDVLYGGRLGGELGDQIANGLAWYALEEVARAATDY